MNPPIHKIAITIRPKSPELASACKQVIETLQKHHIEVCVLDSSGVLSHEMGLESTLFCSKDELPHRAQAIVSLGGDGTLISAVRQSIGYNLPVLGINMGRLGFLTAITPKELDSFIPLLREGTYALDSHHLLQGSLESKQPPTQSNSTHISPAQSPINLAPATLEPRTPFFVLNEILITKKDISGMTKIYATINNEHFHTYRADGLIIATPTGSSAYNISAGGSVVHHKCRVILLTPVCAHSLTQRPMIVGDDFSLHFSVEEDSMIMLDGQERVEFKKGDTLLVTGAFPIQLIQHPKRSYFAVLEEKFGLGG